MTIHWCGTGLSAIPGLRRLIERTPILRTRFVDGEAVCDVEIAIDDYGTGQSTMSYLQRLPAAEIKIDQSFVRTIEHDSANRIMVGSTIQMAQALGLRVVGEGIEDQRCLDILKEFGCDVGQGWHISKPLTAADFVANWLRPDGQLSA